MRKKVAWMKKAENMLECVASLDNGPLYDDNFDLFYTPFPEPFRTDIVKQLNFKLQASSSLPYKFILTGHRGTGKSTELLRVSKLCKDYKTLFVSATDTTGPQGTGYTNLLVLICNAVMKFGVESHYLDENDTAFKSLLEYWNSELEIEQVAKEVKATNTASNLEAEFGGSFSTSFSLLRKLKTILSIGAKATINMEGNYEKNVTVDEIIHTTIAKNDKLFIHAFNVLLKELHTRMGKEKLLIIVEDLDKVGQFDLADDIFNNHCRAFLDIATDMVFTYPIHLQYDPKYLHVHDNFTEVFKLGVFELINENQKYDENAISIFKGLIYKRISEKLIEDKALDLAIKMSGGLIRDVFTMLSEAAVTAGVNESEKISIADVKRAVSLLEDRYTKVIQIEDGFDKIAVIHNNPCQQVDEDMRELLRAEVVLEYSGSRYVVHPIVINFLERMGKQVKKYE